MSEPTVYAALPWSPDARILLALRERLLADVPLRSVLVRDDQIVREHQSARWKQAADSEGFATVGGWLAKSADAYLRLRVRPGIPLPLAWRRGQFRVHLDDGREPEMLGWASPPFGIFHGSGGGPILSGGTHLHTLVYLPGRRIVATFKYSRQCRALSAELAGVYARSGGEGDIRAGVVGRRGPG
jgi:hypothetical protein